VASALPVLAHPADQPFLVYLEVYGLAAREGVYRFEVTYEFEQRRGWLARLFTGTKRIALRFDRIITSAGDDAVVEAVRVHPGQVGPGEFTLTVGVRDLVSGGSGSSRAIRLRLLP